MFQRHAFAVIKYLKHHAVDAGDEFARDTHLGGVGMADDIGQTFLRDSQCMPRETRRVAPNFLKA